MGVIKRFIQGIRIALFAAVALCIIGGGLYLYYSSLMKNLYEQTHQTLDEIMRQQSYTFASKLIGNSHELNSMSELLSRMPDDFDYMLALLGALVRNSDFEYIAIVNTDGKGITSAGGIIDVSDTAYFKRSVRGEVAINEPTYTENGGEVNVVFSSPIKVDSDVRGVLICSYASTQLDSLFVSSFGGKGYAFVCNGDGDVIGKTVNAYSFTRTNILADYASAQFTEGTLDEIRRNMRNMLDGYATYRMNGEVRMVSYAPISINDWYIFTIIPEDVISINANRIQQSAIILTAIIVLTLAGLMFFLYVSQKRYADALYRVAYFDKLTGLPTLERFKIDSQRLLEQHPGTPFAVVKMDIVEFKMINEMHGYETGDGILLLLADVLRKTEDPLFLCGRSASDEFIMLEPLYGADHLDNRRMEIEHEFTMNKQDLPGHNVEFNYGRYYLDKGETNVNNAIERVNLAHRIAKTNKHSRVCEYDDAYKERALRESEIKDKMREALRGGEFKVYLQPKYRLIGETISGAEALVRWYENDGTIVSPGAFIPVFEKNGFIVKLDMYMFDQVCRIMAEWLRDGLPMIVVSVNFSRLHLDNPLFVNDITRIADRHGVPHKYLEIELTESAMLDREDVVETMAAELHEAGFTLSIDDFGTGYSSLGLLKNLPVDVLKMDRSFIVDSKHEQRARAVISNVMNMAKQLDLLTVAEGVEQQEHIDFLRSVGCDYVQGYYYAKPMPADAFTAQLREQRI